jgi:hypothetical protein
MLTIIPLPVWLSGSRTTAPAIASPKPIRPIGIGTVFAVSVATKSSWLSERTFNRFVPSSTGGPSLTTQAGLKTAMRSPLAANELQDSNSQDPVFPISASST